MSLTNITITEAHTQRGWSPTDHLIDDTRLDEVIGRSYATVEHARRAVEARADDRGYATFEFEDGRGRHWRYDCSAGLGIPGRHVRRLTDVTHERCHCA